MTGFAAVPAWVVDDETISQKAKLTYLVLSRHIGRDSLAATLSQGLIARKAGMSARSVRTALSELRELGLVEWESSHRDDGGTSYNTYRMHVHPTKRHDADPPATGAYPPGKTFRGGRQQVPTPPATGAAPYKEEPDVEEPDVEEPPPSTELALVDQEIVDAEIVESDHRPDVERVCVHLADRIEDNGCKRPSITRKWRDAARLLMDRDGKTEEQVHRAIDWCQDDEFWRANVLSMPTLRRQYDTLSLRARTARNSNGRRPSTAEQRFRVGAEIAHRLREQGN